MLKIVDKIYPALIVGVGAVMPFIAGAQITPTGQAANPQDILQGGIRLMNNVMGVIFVLVTLVFLWGVFQFVANPGDEEAKKKGKALMTWGIVGMVIMISVWAIVTGLVGYFGTGGGDIPNVNLNPAL